MKTHFSLKKKKFMWLHCSQINMYLSILNMYILNIYNIFNINNLAKHKEPPNNSQIYTKYIQNIVQNIIQNIVQNGSFSIKFRI